MGSVVKKSSEITLTTQNCGENGYQYFGDLHKKNDIQTIAHIQSNGGTIGNPVDVSNPQLVGIYIPLWPKQTEENERK